MVKEIIEARKKEMYFHQTDESREVLFKEDVLDIVRTTKLETIEKACKWWEDELYYPSMTDREIKWYKAKINKFFKEMGKYINDIK